MNTSSHKVSVTSASLRGELRENGDTTFDPATHRLNNASDSRSTLAATPTSNLHTQDLVDVMVELEPYQSDHRVAFAFEMAQDGRVHPLNEDELKNLRKERDGIFGPSQRDTPTLSAELPFTSTSLPSPAAIENAIKSDIGGKNHFRFAPSRGSPERDAHAIMRLLDNIGHARYSEPGAVVHMQSPTFDRAKRYIPGWEGDGTLAQSNFQLTIAPAGEIFELEYYDHHFSSTLLTGSKVWLTFPPLQANLLLLRKAYEDMHTANTSRVPLAIISELQHGIVIIQKRGQTLVLPPYWSHMTFFTTTTTLCSFFVATAAQYMSRINNMDIWLNVNLFWDTAEQQQAHLVSYATELATHFAAIMTGNFKRFKAGPVRNQICSEWAKVAPDNAADFGNMQDKIGALLALIQDEEVKDRIDDEIRHAWIEFIQEKRKKKPECRLCHVRIEHMPAGETPDERLARHVTDVHCLYEK
jgi:hypothetical protein